MKKIVTLGVTALAALSLVGCGNNSSGSSKENKAATSSSAKVASNEITREQFDAIKIGDLMKQGSGGDTLQTLTDKFGKPQSTSETTTSGVKTKSVTWTNVTGGFGASVIVQFVDDHAASKNLTGFKINRSQRITLDNFNSLQTGQSYTDITDKISKPDSYNEMILSGVKTTTATYVTGVQGDSGAHFVLTFNNDTLASKTQTNMK